MIELGGDFKVFELNVGIERSKKMVGLSGACFSWGFSQRGILFQGLVIAFHVPPFFVECGDAVIREFGVVADQIEDAG